MKILLTPFITIRCLVNKIRKMWQPCSLPAIRLHDSRRMVKLMDLSGSFWFQKRYKTEFHQAMVKTSKSAGLKAKSTYFTTDLRIQWKLWKHNQHCAKVPSHFQCSQQAPRLVLLLAPSGALIAIPTYLWYATTITHPTFSDTLWSWLSLSNPLQLYQRQSLDSSAGNM